MKFSIFSTCLFCIAILASSCQPATERPQVTDSGESNNAPSTTGQSQPENVTQLNLSINDLNSTPPQDILEEVEFYGGLGGGEEGCSPSYNSPTFISGENDENPELLEQIVIYICGIPTVGENIDVTVALPDGSVRKYAERADDQSDLYFHYPSEFSDPTGNYKFNFNGSNWSLEKNIVIHDISRTSLFFDGEQIIFTKFQPNENVRLFAYRSNGDNATFIGWKSFRMDSRGQLIINNDLSDVEFVAIGEKSGEVQYIVQNTRWEWPWQPISKNAPENTSPSQESQIPFCSGPLPSRLFVGAKAEVTTSGMAPQLSLRAQPNLSAEKVHVIAAGRDMVILDGPVCADGSYWWYIRSEQGFEGWSREGDSEDYWIDPLP